MKKLLIFLIFCSSPLLAQPEYLCEINNIDYWLISDDTYTQNNFTAFTVMSHNKDDNEWIIIKGYINETDNTYSYTSIITTDESGLFDSDNEHRIKNTSFDKIKPYSVPFYAYVQILKDWKRENMK